MRIGHAVRALPCLLSAVVVACGSSPSAASGAEAASTTTPVLSGSITVFAAASLTGAFRDGETTLEQHNPDFRATYAFAGSQQLVSNIRNGAPADVIATADTSTMQSLVTAGLVEMPMTFARNTLAIAVARGNPRGIARLADLANPSLSVVLADASVPAGRFARQALLKAGVTVIPKSNELDVTSTLQKVVSGDADAAIVYSTDVSAAHDRVDGVPIPDGQNVVATYPIAVVRTTHNHAAAVAFVDEVVSGEVQRALVRRGFLPP